MQDVTTRLPRVVLVGGGHTHVQVLRRHAMKPFAAELTLVVDDPVAVYSGMVPGLVAGQYQRAELEIDVRALARRAGVRVLVARATRVDAAGKQVHLEGRPPLRYDLASLNIGSTVAGLDVPGVREHTLPTRPIQRLVEQLEARLATLPDPCRIVVVGAGAGGVELAFCLEQRLRDEGRQPHVTLAFGSERVLSNLHPRISRRIEAAATKRSIALRPSFRVTEVRADGVLADDAHLPADLVVWVTGAAGLGLGAASGLPVDTRGYIQVDDTLRVTPELFAVGDCAVPQSWPHIPKAGVYAVREGPVLIDNLERLLAGRTPQPYRPQRDFFGIFNLGDGTAVGAKWGIPIAGRWVMWWKDRIDRAFMERFQVLGPDGPAEAFLKGMPPMPELEMVCGGCAAKVGQDALSRALARLEPAPAAPGVVLGLQEADDAVAFEADGVTWVQNVDAFPAFVDDPWLVGKVAAHNANSDLYAKGVDPTWALASVQIPQHADEESTLFQVMSGIREVLDAEGITLLGGHTLVGEKLVVGLTVTGRATGPLWTITRAVPGDTVLLTRPLGSGVLLHADMAGRARGPHVRALLQAMAQGSRAASHALRGQPVHAVTDVTGFGLAGHLAEVAQASGVSIEIDLACLPAADGALALLDAGERSTFHPSNRSLVRALRAEADGPRLELCFDPQTAGGLVITTPDPAAIREALAAADVPCWTVGQVAPPRSDSAPLRLWSSA